MTSGCALIGIDTPETVKPGTPVQCFGPEASARTKALLPPGTAVRLERDVEARDRYGRLLAYVYRAPTTGCSSTSRSCADGFAALLTIPPERRPRRRVRAAAADAREPDAGCGRPCGAQSAVSSRYRLDS